MILIDSIYINNSGGRVLLNYLVEQISSKIPNIVFAFDKRCEGSFLSIPKEKKFFINPTFKDRHSFYKTYSHLFKVVLCFGNVPPTVRSDAVVITYFHNVLLINPSPFHFFLEKVILLLKTNFINYFKGNSDHFIFQSDFVRTIFCKKFKFKEANTYVIPFYPPLQIISPAIRERKGFLFVSDGNPHKNHLNLLKAWSLVCEDFPNEELHLTVSTTYPKLVNTINIYQKKLPGIINHGILDRKELSDLYQKAQYIVYPSVMESFGLGLIEGIEFGCDVLASNLPYVHAVASPSAVFDPLDPRSIAKVMKNAISNIDSYPKTQLKVNDQINSLIDLLLARAN